MVFSTLKSLTAVSLAFLTAISLPATQAKVAGAERTAPWNSETSDLKVDESITFGRLSNGMIYAIRPNDTPQNQVIIRMAFDFGSAAEEADEQGLAHFIEHMAFNGTTNVPEGEMVKMLERLGLAFGADTNASTGYTQTIYKLDLPRKDINLIERALFLMRETASEITFNSDAVDRERGVVLSEKRQRENFGYQALRARNAFFYPGSFYSERYPIGTGEVLKNASAAQMKALYQKWYRPDRTRLIITGPVDVETMERMIVQKFGDWKNKGEALGEIDSCKFDTARAGGSAQFTHPKLTDSVSVLQIVPDKKRKDNFERALLDLRMEIAGTIINDRLTRASRKSDIPYLGAQLIFQPGFCDAHARIGFRVSAKDGKVAEILPFVEQGIRQAAQFGFTAQEISEQLKRQDSRFANNAKRADTRESKQIANILASLDDNVLNDPKDLQLLWLQLKPFMNAQDIRNEFAGWLNQLDRPLLFFQGKQKSDLAALKSAYDNSRLAKLNPPEEREALAFAYDKPGTPGKIISDSVIADLGIRTIRFANNVRLNLKQTDFEDNSIRFSYRIEGGQLLFGKEKAPLSGLANGAYVSGGLEAHSLDDLRSIFAGQIVRPAFAVRDDHFGASGSTSPDDLAAQLKLLAAYITYPGYREDALRLFRRPLDEQYARHDATPSSALSIARSKILTNGDLRFSLAPLETVKALDFEQLKSAFGDSLKNNPLEIGLVGDFDEDTAIAAVAESFGALPERKAQSEDYAAARETAWSGKTGVHEIPHKGEPDQLTWRRTWTTTDNKDQKLNITMDLLASAATIRILDELREKLGATYGGGARSFMSDIYPNRGTFSVITAGDPKDLKAIEEAVDKIIAELVAAPVDADLFERARKPRLESYTDWRKRNGTWISVTDRAQSRPDRLDWFRDSEKIFRTITPADLHKAAIRFLKDKESYIFRAIPAADIGAKEAETLARKSEESKTGS